MKGPAIFQVHIGVPIEIERGLARRRGSSDARSGTEQALRKLGIVVEVDETVAVPIAAAGRLAFHDRDHLVHGNIYEKRLGSARPIDDDLVHRRRRTNAEMLIPRQRGEEARARVHLMVLRLAVGGQVDFGADGIAGARRADEPHDQIVVRMDRHVFEQDAGLINVGDEQILIAVSVVVKGDFGARVGQVVRSGFGSDILEEPVSVV